ncbi:hypothetical protein ACE193_18460 [Bernardetia sp. OM2101]|uniref:hypothetical protein n=1 Tax=Bernardetia sp. OM2101 TaxID=3344876 RepID=UPI0035CF6E82
MKKQIITLLAIISVLASSCDKEEIPLGQDYFGVAQAIKNGEKWKPYIYATSSRRDPEYIAIEMKVYNRYNIAREALFFTRVKKKEGSNAIKTFLYDASYFGYVSDGDVICASYQVGDSTEVAGHINVTKYNEENGALEGNFEVTLVKNYNCDESAPDTLHFTEGAFSTRVQD